MKSSIKIDYAGLHEGLDQENKQPLIRIDLQKSDDPRDTLLNELVTPTTVFGFRLKSINDVSSTYVLWAKTRYAQVSDIAESVYNVCKVICSDKSLEMCTSNDEFYFIIETKETPYRSKGVLRNSINFLPNNEIYEILTKDFLLFNNNIKE